ncbi:MAG: response regulator [Nitrospira sp.]
MQARILIVDDDYDILTALKKRLTWMGHEVLTAEDGEQGLRLVAEEQPDLMG